MDSALFPWQSGTGAGGKAAFGNCTRRGWNSYFMQIQRGGGMIMSQEKFRVSGRLFNTILI